MKDSYFMKDRRVNSSDGVHFQDQQSLQLVKTNNPIVNTLQKPLMRSIEKSLIKGHVTSRRKVLEKRQLIYDGSTPASSRNVDSFQIEASTPSKRKATPLKGFSINLVDSRANKNNANIATANRLSEGIQILPHPLHFFSKFSDVTVKILTYLLFVCCLTIVFISLVLACLSLLLFLSL
ncbi:hypothetical protein PanWU01x14_056350 [Parasponia andersonii]|uniref:Transmembrane protein n=1 Tax=Parasponia andersonii TaxID=3476 RepID=A0A2P5DKC0_PARAD|nr:hypothetical protein PanWU01x14_056350 [Parasponia andersonii]